MARSSRKSRTGCFECKRRHVKCDETHPSCVNCSNSNRQCSYLSLQPRVPATAHRASSETFPFQEPLRFSLSPVQCHQLGSARYGLQELELLHHFENGMAECMVKVHESSKSICRLSVEQAFSRPFLIDQILAVSAAHMSTVRIGEKAWYRYRATALQIRAVASFNAETVNISTQNCLQVFLFSSFLGYQVLFETLLTRDNFPTFLDHFATCLRLQRGIRSTIGNFWDDVEARLQPIVDLRGCSSSRLTATEETSRFEWNDNLTSLLETANLTPSSIDACEHAVKCLRQTFEASRSKPSRAASSVLAWCVHIREEFINLLRQHRPEALVILAHYAVLLYNIKDVWVVGDVGEFIIRSIAASLGPFWRRWLVWPSEATSGGPEHPGQPIGPGF
ncbi:hypothetical protein BJY01DRAFT_232704 [Aspergillus pseudoustus]|uniref:Zn(2)-C6 fungal-type domain-containing protein n=1 Tax=Aspergillus pseudoustus TaxID=1810923 RepID=A0ABR4KIJ4_9EURO